jgi:hypothetical protein
VTTATSTACALDDFAQAERLLERGTREGFLRLRAARRRSADVLAAGFGATICGRHLGGVAALLTAPYEADRAGRDRRPLLDQPLQGRGRRRAPREPLLPEAMQRGLSYVFACAVDERAKLFFARQGFERVPGRSVPAAKWVGYDDRRRVPRRVLPRDLRVRARGARLMAGALRVLGGCSSSWAWPPPSSRPWVLRGDTQFAEIAEAYARHPEHALFRGGVSDGGRRGTTASSCAGVVGGCSPAGGRRGCSVVVGELLRAPCPPRRPTQY